jgi:hypothetical protein
MSAECSLQSRMLMPKDPVLILGNYEFTHQTEDRVSFAMSVLNL